MALIQNDPKQAKTVVALVVVLAIALAAVVVRMRAAQQQVPPAPANAPTAGATVSSVAYMDNGEFELARNPFRKPARVTQAGSRNDSLLGEGPMKLNVPRLSLGQEPETLAVRPMEIEPAPRSREQAQPEAPRPVFSLLATIKGQDGYSAVIRTGETDVRVVEVGDTLQDGFKVKLLEEGRAVLTDGRDTIVAKRPQS